MSKVKILLIDGLNVAKASYAVAGHLMNSSGMGTGMIYNFLSVLISLKNKFPEYDRVIIAWDSYPTWRVEYYPMYKGTRTGGKKEDKEKFNLQLSILQKLLRLLNVHQYCYDKLEADDIAGMLVRKVAYDIVLVSNDKDWLQLVNNRTKVYRPMSKQLVEIDNFQQMTGFEDPRQFLEVKCIVGDKGDNVPGLAGIGEKTALKFLNNELNPESSTYQKIVEWKKDINGYTRSRYLMDLLDIVPEHGPQKFAPEPFSGDIKPLLKKKFEELEFSLFLKKFDEICETFNVPSE